MTVIDHYCNYTLW